MIVERCHRLLWLVLLLVPLALGIVMYCHKTEDVVAVCECAVSGRSTTNGEFGNFHSVRQSAEWLFETAKSEEFKNLLFERCTRDLKPVSPLVVSNAVNGIVIEVLSRGDNEWRFSITARSTQRHFAIAVANDCAEVLKELWESKNRCVLEKAVSRILDNKAKLERNLANLKAEIKRLQESSSDDARDLNIRLTRMQEEIVSLTRDEMFVRTNYLANCDIMLILDRAE